jgi:hypothetical protein
MAIALDNGDDSLAVAHFITAIAVTVTTECETHPDGVLEVRCLGPQPGSRMHVSESLAE